MKLPFVNEPHRYRGLYVYDFGEWSAFGYTAEEIAILLESPAHGGGKIYQIVRATPDGQMELRGVAPERFQTESGMFFNRSELDAAAADFDDLIRLAESDGPPCRAFQHLADRGPGSVQRYVTALIYPAEYEDQMARWLLDAAYAGGDTAEGGPSHVANYHASEHKILRRQQLWSSSAIPARPADEVLASVRRAVQR
jgi:hypothetical protein